MKITCPHCSKEIELKVETKEIDLNPGLTNEDMQFHGSTKNNPPRKK